jgi:hypothetical protein
MNDRRQSLIDSSRSRRCPPQKLVRDVTPASELPGKTRGASASPGWHVAHEKAFEALGDAAVSAKSVRP